MMGSRLALFRAGAAIGRLADLHAAILTRRRTPRQPGSVAVVRTDNIGDFILWLDGARAIRKRYPRPEHRVSLIASSQWSDFAQASGLFDEVIAVEPARLFGDGRYRRATVREIAGRGFEVAINPMYSRNVWTDDVLVRATGAPVRLGQRGDNANVRPAVKAIADRWYTALAPAMDPAAHELERNWQFARQFDASMALRGPELEPSMIRKPRWQPADRKYFVLAPGAADPIRQWPMARFGEIAARLHAQTGWRGIVCGVAAEAAATRELVRVAGDIPILDACGRTRLSELAGVIGGAGLVVTNETGAVHLAAALRVPAVAILGGGHFGRFLPYPAQSGAPGASLRIACHEMPCFHCNWRCIYPLRPQQPAPCIGSVTVDAVWAQIQAALAAA